MSIDIKIGPLTNLQQAFLMLLVFVLPAVIVWFSNAMPVDRSSLGLLFAAILSAILVFIKEILGATLNPPAPYHV